MDDGRPAWRSRAWLVAVAIVAALAMVLAMVGVDNPGSAWLAVTTAVAVGAVALAWTFVRTRTQRRQHEDELAAWAAERAAQAERLRIAADLHDLVSHGLGLITVRAAAARSVTGTDGAAERAAALADIESTSRATTLELRRMLGVLRTPGTAPLRPSDSLEDLPRIIANASETGLAVELEVGELGEVSPGAQLTVCAVVREALANSLRHAGPPRAHVDVRREREAIVVDVRDAGPRDGWTSHPGSGHGLAGARSRVAALGGTLTAGREGRGFRVLARVFDGEAG